MTCVENAFLLVQFWILMNLKTEKTNALNRWVKALMKWLRNRPTWQFTVILFSVFVCESIVMVALHFWQLDTRLVIAVDSVMLSFLIFPILSALLLRPQPLIFYYKEI